MRPEYSQSIIPVKSQSSLTQYSVGSSFKYMEFSERLRHARESAKLTQEDLAQKSGVKQGTISKIERGDTDSSTFTVQLAIACGVRPEWLAIEDGPMLDEYKIAKEIANKLEAKERARWYRIGRSLAEPSEGTNGEQ